MKDERLVSKMDGKTNCSRRVKQCDGLTRLISTPVILRQICATVDVCNLENARSVLAIVAIHSVDDAAVAVI